MRSVEEIIKFCELRARQLGYSMSEVLVKAGCCHSLFSMAKRRNSYMRIENIIDIAKVLGVSEGEILGLATESLPEDISVMVSMLKQISPESRRMIMMNIDNYFSVENRK